MTMKEIVFLLTMLIMHLMTLGDVNHQFILVSLLFGELSSSKVKAYWSSVLAVKL